MTGAIILAAGQSKRMGKPKMTLPWGNTSILGHVIDVLRASMIEDIVVICGAAREEVETLCHTKEVRVVFNQAYASGEMLSSVQTGLRAMEQQIHAVMIVLGDQPQIQENTVQMIIDEYIRTKAGLIIPSYQNHRGHPWLVAKEYWDEILQMERPESLREFLMRRAADIHYVLPNTPTILQDVDTPAEYLNSRP